MTQHTEVTLRIDLHGGTPDRPLPRYLLTVSGQPAAGSRPDAMRVAVCTLVQTVSCYLAGQDWNVLDDFDLEGVPGSGWCSVLAVPTEQGSSAINGAFRMTAAGFELLARQFPQRLRFALKEAPRRGSSIPKKSAEASCPNKPAVVQ